MVLVPVLSGRYFNPRSPWGERRYEHSYSQGLPKFQSTLPVGGATMTFPPRLFLMVFQSTLPVGGATWYRGCLLGCRSDFNPRSPWGERPPIDKRRYPVETISIHAPRGGSDFFPILGCCNGRDFNPRSPWGERPRVGSLSWIKMPISIHAPRGGSDAAAGRCNPDVLYFNPRSPWGERPQLFIKRLRKFVISIHAPRGGSD